MNFIVTKDSNIPDILLIYHNKYSDNRGYLYETFNTSIISEYIKEKFVQEKCGYSKYGVLRGLHFQKHPYEQGKLVRCSSGEIYDIAVDIRKESKTYKKYVIHKLSDSNNTIIYIPPGFAHGILCSSKQGSLFHYFTTNQFAKDYESGLLWSDPSININIPIPISDIILSDKDKELPTIEKL
jgi:dTDP-4-dehydrorhamnose 3,5-epimerase